VALDTQTATLKSSNTKGGRAPLTLCINARDAMPDGGHLTISTDDVRLSAMDIIGQEGAKPGDYVAISVADTGKGMPADVLE
jgi:signal transduction histidine kinase